LLQIGSDMNPICFRSVQICIRSVLFNQTNLMSEMAQQYNMHIIAEAHANSMTGSNEQNSCGMQGLRTHACMHVKICHREPETLTVKPNL